MLGRTIGKYRILALLGRGGMGPVYRGVDQELGRDVAIKILTADMLHGAPLAQFEADAAILEQLNHPSIAAIYEIHHAASDVLMVMELVRGETLDQMLARVGAMPPERAAFVVVQVLGALGHAHTAGIVHRDLKPSNVMITETGGVKLLDFGTSRISSAALMTALGPTFGASAYMAPERILGHEVDARADLYSAGVLFYRLLTGALPFEAASPADLVQRQLSDLPIPVRSRRADLPEWCEAVITRALAKSPDERFQRADEFASALLTGIGGAAGDATGFLPVYQSTDFLPAPSAIEAASPASESLPAEIPDSSAPPAEAAVTLATALAVSSTDPMSPVVIDDPAGLAGTLAMPVAQETPSESTEAAAVPPPVDPYGPTLVAPVPEIPEAALAPTLAMLQPDGALSAVPAYDPLAPTLMAPVVTEPVTPAMPLAAADPLAATLATAIPEAVALPPTLQMPLDGVPGVPAAALAPTLAMPQGAAQQVTLPPGWAPPVSAPPATLAPTLAMPQGAAPPTLPPGWAPTVSTPSGALAPTLAAPAPAQVTTTLVMERKQFAAAGVLLATLAIGVVVLAVIVLRRPAEIVVTPATPAASPAPVSTAAPAPAPEPTPIVDPPIITELAAPPAPPLAVAEPKPAAARPPATAASAPTTTSDAPANAARPISRVPFVFEARAVVADGDKHREREANVLVADGAINVSQKDDKPIYVIPLADITKLTYSNSRQPLWDSPNGPAEAMRVEGGTFGFLKAGERHWFGIRTTDSLLVLRVDDSMVARVITGLQERVGLTVARLIEPRE